MVLSEVEKLLVPKVSHAGLLIGLYELSIVWASDNKPGSPRARILRQEPIMPRHGAKPEL